MKYLIKATAVACMLSIQGCSPNIEDLQEYTEQVRQSAKVNIEPYKEFAPQPLFTYKASNLRSPFTTEKQRSDVLVAAPLKNCLQPDRRQVKGSLEQYGIDALTFTGSFIANGAQWVLFSANDGSLHKAKIGTRIGLYYGKITKIAPDSVTITELLPDGAGCWKPKETQLSSQS